MLKESKADSHSGTNSLENIAENQMFYLLCEGSLTANTDHRLYTDRLFENSYLM